MHSHCKDCQKVSRGSSAGIRLHTPSFDCDLGQLTLDLRLCSTAALRLGDRGGGTWTKS